MFKVSRGVCETLTMPPVATKSRKAIFSAKVKVKVTRSLTEFWSWIHPRGQDSPRPPLTMPPAATKSRKAIFSAKVKVKVTRSLTLVSF